MATRVAHVVGTSYSFMVALAVVLVWAATGPIFHYSDTWQLVINTGTTIITFLMVFLIQNSQNRDSHAVHLKLDELIKSHRKARNFMVNLEDMTDEQLERIQQEFANIRDDHEEGKPDSERISAVRKSLAQALRTSVPKAGSPLSTEEIP